MVLTPLMVWKPAPLSPRAPPHAPRAKPEFEQLSVTSEVYDEKCNIRVGAVLQYLFGRRGPLATTGCDHGAFLRTSGEAGGPVQTGLGVVVCIRRRSHRAGVGERRSWIWECLSGLLGERTAQRRL